VAEIYEPAAKLKRSYDSEEHFIRTVLSYFGRYSLKDISPMLIERFKRERLATPVTANGKPRKPASVNRDIACLSRICTMAIDNGMLQKNPCSKVKRLRENNIRTRYLTDAEEKQLMDAIAGPFERLRPIIILALNTGMRQGEIVGLKWSNVDWQREIIQVTNTKNADDRAIPMNDTMKALLLKLWRDRSTERVFNEQAGPVSYSFRRLARNAKLVDFHFHDLRHTFATRLAPHTDAFTLAALLGHKTLAMTARYTHATAEGKRRAVVALNNVGQDSVTIVFPAQAAQAG
jgi:integrase